MQTYFVNERIEQLKRIKDALINANEMIEKGEEIDWASMIDKVNNKEMEESIKKQYENSSNIEARISLHKLCSTNSESWFKWIYRLSEVKENLRVLELGCGDATMWLENYDLLPKDVEIVLSDISSGMIRDIDLKLKNDKRFTFKVINGQCINFNDKTFDIVIANHVLFYLDDIPLALKEIHRVLKDNRDVIYGVVKNCFKEPVSNAVVKLVEVVYDCGKEYCLTEEEFQTLKEWWENE